MINSQLMMRAKRSPNRRKRSAGRGCSHVADLVEGGVALGGDDEPVPYGRAAAAVRVHAVDRVALPHAQPHQARRAQKSRLRGDACTRPATAGAGVAAGGKRLMGRGCGDAHGAESAAMTCRTANSSGDAVHAAALRTAGTGVERAGVVDDGAVNTAGVMQRRLRRGVDPC